MDEIPEIPALTIDEVAARLGEPDYHVFDNNWQGRYRRSHVPTATLLNAYNYEAAALPSNKAATLVFYCTGPG
jgi:hypothetical protein